MEGDYQPWENRGRQPGYQSHDQWKPPVDRLDDETTFKHDYKRHHPEPRKNYKPDERAQHSDDPIDDQTIHRRDYVPHALQPREQREKPTYKPVSAPMDGMTTHRRDYKGAPGSRGHPCKPDNQAYQSHAPLDDETNYVHDYRPWPTSRPYHHRPDEYQEPQGEFQDSTTHKTAFKELPLVKSIRKKPESANRNNNAPFEGRTNYYDDFQPKQGDRALIPRQTEYKPSSAPFGGDSTYKKHYVPHSQQPSQSCRPDNKPQQSDERFAGDTMYKTDYTPKYADICPTIPIIRGHSNKYQFIELSSAGHKMYEPIYTTISPLQSRDRRLSNQRLAMSYA